MLILIGYIHVSPSAAEEFLADLRVLSLTVKASPGCFFYTAALEDVHAGRLLVVERWQHQAALSAHLEAPHTLKFVEKWMHRMKGDVQKYDVLNERPLLG